MNKAKENLLIIASSEEDANLYYASKFLAPDPFIWMQVRGKRILLMNDLELDRARSQAKADQVLSLSQLSRDYFKALKRHPSQAELIATLARKLNARKFLVPANFQLGYYEALRAKGLSLTVKPDPFFENRLIKTPQEIRAIEKALRQVEKAAALAVKILRASIIRNGKLYYKGKPLTSEILRQRLHAQMLENGCVATRTIISSGEDTVNPHEEGSGVLFAHQPIILDIFPRDVQTRYYADFTRTFVRGEASHRLKKMYQAVREAQEIAFKLIGPGVDASTVHQKVSEHFTRLGFLTGVVKGKTQGFFHGTGHGLGLELHELPSLGRRKEILRAGEVITVEPGLYYPGIGGVRLEDIALVTRSGSKNLTRFPKFLEL